LALLRQSARTSDFWATVPFGLFSLLGTGDATIHVGGQLDKEDSMNSLIALAIIACEIIATAGFRFLACAR
jgi:hypothetical protein